MNKKDPQKNKWYKFDDSAVAEVTEYEAINMNFGGFVPTPNKQIVNITDIEGSVTSAYMLVYIQKKYVNDILHYPA